MDRETINSTAEIASLSETERAALAGELVEIINEMKDSGQLSDDLTPLEAAIERWLERAGKRVLEDVWQSQEPLSGDAAMELALEAQRAAREN